MKCEKCGSADVKSLSIRIDEWYVLDENGEETGELEYCPQNIGSYLCENCNHLFGLEKWGIY